MGFNKKVLSKAVSELDKAKAPAKPRDIITDPMGQWKYPGQKTRIPGSSITMQGVDYPVWAQPNVGPGSMMQPNQDYEFPNADYVDETPMAKKGGTLKSKKYSKSMSATNKLFAKNKLFESKKSKIFDPNAKFKSGGSKLGPINLNPNPLSHYELNYGFNLPTKEDGGENEDEYMDLTDEEIQAYRDGGYVVEELHEAQEGGPKDTIIYPPGDSEYMNQPALNYDILEMQNQKARRNYEQYLKDNTDPTNIQRTSPSFQQKYFMNKDVDTAEIGGYVQHELAKAQVGLEKQENDVSLEDYLKLYENSLALEKDITSMPNYELRNTDTNVDDYLEQLAQARENWSDNPRHMKTFQDRLDPNNKAYLSNMPESQRADLEANLKRFQDKANINDYHTVVSPNNFYQRDISNSFVNTKFKPAYYDTRIKPSSLNRYVYKSLGENDDFDDAIELYKYDPAEVKKQALLKYTDSIEQFDKLDASQNSQSKLSELNKEVNNGQIIVPGQTTVAKTMRVPVQGVEDYWIKDPVLGNVKRQRPVTTWKEVPYTDEGKSTQGYNIKTGSSTNQTRKYGGALDKAQVGLETYSGPKFALQGPSSPKPKVDTSPTVANAKKLEQYYKLQEQKKQQAIAKQKEIELMKRMPKTQVSDNTRTVIPKQAVSDIRNTAIINSPEYKAQQKAKKEAAALAEAQRKKAQAEFEKKQWEKYNKASTMEKIVDRTQAALSQPLLMASNALMGEQAYVPGMHEGLMNTESPDYDKWLSATGQSRGLGVNDVFNTFNPGNWGAHASNEINKGNIASGAAEMGLGLLGLKGLKTASGLVKGSANLLNKAEGKLSKFIPESVPGTPSTGGGNLNAGISPQLIKNFVGPKNKVLANILDQSYTPFLNKMVNRISPLNWVPGYGKKLEGAIKPLGNVIGKSVKDGKLVEPKSLFKQAKGLVKKSPDADLTTKIGKTNAGDIYSARINSSANDSRIGLGSANKQGFIGRNFRKGNASYPIQNMWGTNLNQVPLTDPGVSLHRRLPFSNRYASINPEKLLNNKFQWSTTGAGAQKLAEKFGTSSLIGGLGAGAYAGATYDPYNYIDDEDVVEQMRIENIAPEEVTDIPTRTEAILEGVGQTKPTEYFKEQFNPVLLNSIVYGDEEPGNKKLGGAIHEVWEDELDDHTIALLRKAGYTVEELD